MHADSAREAAQSNASEFERRSGIERRRHPRVSLDAPAEDAASDAEAPVERRKLDRRGLDALRAEIQWTFAEEAEGISFGGKRRVNVPRRARMKHSRLLLLAVAIFSGGLAAFLAFQNNDPVAETAVVEAAVPQVVEEPRVQVLVAKQAIGIGQHLQPATIAWEEWPAGSVLEDYVTIEASPEALTEMNSAVARFDFFPGDPIRTQKLVEAREGYLSAVLATGMRGVSVNIAAESASGGFITPNDHVDVVLTRSSSASEISETILHNVRVLAINARLGETGTTGAPEEPAADLENPKAQMFANAIATLELDSAQAETIISATAVGRLSLVLRSMSDFGEEARIEQRGSNQAIRISSPFWTGGNSTEFR